MPGVLGGDGQQPGVGPRLVVVVPHHLVHGLGELLAQTLDLQRVRSLSKIREENSICRYFVYQKYVKEVYVHMLEEHD